MAWGTLILIALHSWTAALVQAGARMAAMGAAMTERELAWLAAQRQRQGLDPDRITDASTLARIAVLIKSETEAPADSGPVLARTA